jgi:quercetin dioxygenase-like cupin family protein
MEAVPQCRDVGVMARSDAFVSSGFRVVKDDERYRVLDFLIPEIEPGTLSLTELKRGMATRGHSHPNPEAYLFLSPAVLQTSIDGKTVRREVGAGDVVVVRSDEFHRVWSMPGSSAKFVSVFLGQREHNLAKYS